MFKSDRKYWLIIAVVIALLAGGMDRASAALLPVDNWNFEQNDPQANGTWAVSALDGWTIAGSGGTFFADRDGEYESPPSSRVAWSNGGTLSQTLTNTLTDGHLYTLTVDVGNRVRTAFPGYSIELWEGGNLFVSASSPMPADGYFTTVEASRLADHDGGQLEIRLTSVGIQTNFDNVRLSNTVPEPATFIFLSTGLLGLAEFGRKKIKA